MKALQATLFLLFLIPAAAAPLVAEEATSDVTIEGEILDLACYVSHEVRGADHADCAKRCVQAGQPMGLLTAEGAVYVLFADHKDSAAFEAAKNYAGETVRITGTVSEQAGVQGLTVHAVESS